jgi:pSer/pThr/pTyr-binding forkhead associated (FHA) protein
MSDVRPELVFLSGPRAGTRTVLASNAQEVGRSPSADVVVEDAHASRRQMRLRLTPAGWLMENLSSNGTLVNGTRIKSAGKKVLLATGDVFTVGVGTRILFVAPGDDADQAVLDWQEANPLPEVAPPADEEPSGEGESAEAHAGGPPTEPVHAPATEVIAPPPGRPPRSKFSKYVVFAAIYVAALLGLIFYLATTEGRGQKDAERRQMLSENRIAQVLGELPDEKTHLPAKAQAELAEALGLYANLPSRPGDLYRCVRNFQLYLAHVKGNAFADVQDELRYGNALDRLTRSVDDLYRKAWGLEQSGQWQASAAAWGQLKAELPETDETSPVFRHIISNVDAHLTFVRGRAQRTGRR